MVSRSYSDSVPTTTVQTVGGLTSSSTSLVLSQSLTTLLTPPFVLWLEPGVAGQEELVLVNSGQGTSIAPYVIQRAYGTSTAHTHAVGVSVKHALCSVDLTDAQFHFAANTATAHSPAAIRSVSVSATLADTDAILAVDASGGVRTVTVPTAVGRSGKMFSIIRTNTTGANAVTITPATGQNINGYASISLTTAYDYSQIVSDGSNWYVIGGTGTGAGAGPNPGPTGASGTWTLGFYDEFNGTSIDTTKWQYQSSAEANWFTSPFGTSNPGNQQLEFDSPNNVSVSGGNMILHAKPDNIVAGGTTYNWSSGYVTSTGSAGYTFRYAFIETRCQMPPIRGFWPAFWTWQAAGNTTYTETDVFEYYSDNHTKLYITQHSGTGGGITYTPPFDPAAGMHTYGANITSGGTDFYVDGLLVVHASGVPVGNTNIIVDNFVYSGNGNTALQPAPGTSGDLLVDYVRTWT